MQTAGLAMGTDGITTLIIGDHVLHQWYKLQSMGHSDSISKTDQVWTRTKPVYIAANHSHS